MLPVHLVLIAAATGLSVAPAAAGSLAWPICAAARRTTCVVDGDTFWKDRIKYRLANIDAPELGDRAACAAERRRGHLATRALQSLLNAGPITLHAKGRDRYGRILVIARDRKGRDIGVVMIATGLARPFPSPPFSKLQWCR